MKCILCLTKIYPTSGGSDKIPGDFARLGKLKNMQQMIFVHLNRQNRRSRQVLAVNCGQHFSSYGRNRDHHCPNYAFIVSVPLSDKF